MIGWRKALLLRGLLVGLSALLGGCAVATSEEPDEAIGEAIENLADQPSVSPDGVAADGTQHPANAGSTTENDPDPLPWNDPIVQQMHAYPGPDPLPWTGDNATAPTGGSTGTKDHNK
jgi:hypothetical protein